MKLTHFLFFLLFFTGRIFSQTRYNDSLELELARAKNDTARLNILGDLCFKGLLSDTQKVMKHVRETFNICDALEKKSVKGRVYEIVIRSRMNAYHAMGNLQMEEGRMEEARKTFEAQKDIAEKAASKEGMAGSYHNLGIACQKSGDLAKALEYYFKSLKINEEQKNKRYQANALNNIGNIYYSMKNFNNALTYYTRALNLKIEMNDKRGQCNTYLNIGGIYRSLGNSREAIAYYLKSASLSEELHNKKGMANAYNNIANVFEKERPDSAMRYYAEALKISREIGYKLIICSADLNLANICTERKQYNKAIDYMNEGLQMAKEINEPEYLKEAYLIFADNYAKMQNYKVAFEYHKKYMGIKDSLFNDESTRQMNEMNSKYESEKKDQEIKLLNKDIALDQKEIEKQSTQRNAFIIGFVLVLITLIFIFRGYKQKQKANTEIHNQKQLVDQKNKDITDSINYARRIQEALLPADELKQRLFPESFILFKPRDIVSGDFYWIAEKSNRKFIAAVDCTGHGVPGAFMSMIGTAFLHEIVNEKGIVSPGEILDQLREKVIVSLKQNDSDNKDGMDISLLAMNEDGKTLEFAGANNPLWLIRDGVLKEIKGDKQPIGLHQNEVRKFTTHSLQIQKNDRLYIFTDGYADQFGGEKGKKFKYRQLQELLSSYEYESLSEQCELLSKKITEWRGKLEQVDDILVIGIKV